MLVAWEKKYCHASEKMTREEKGIMSTEALYSWISLKCCESKVNRNGYMCEQKK